MVSDLSDRARNYANMLNITSRNELAKRPSIEDREHAKLLRELAGEIERLEKHRDDLQATNTAEVERRRKAEAAARKYSDIISIFGLINPPHPTGESGESPDDVLRRYGI